MPQRNTPLQPVTPDEAVSATNSESDSPPEERDTRSSILPDQRTMDEVWLIATISFAIVLVGSFVAIAITMIESKQGTDILLALFTTVAGFFSGILTGKSIQKRSQS